MTQHETTDEENVQRRDLSQRFLRSRWLASVIFIELLVGGIRPIRRGIQLGCEQRHA